MRISDNRLSSLHKFYQNELAPVYGESETQALFNLAVEYYLNIPKNEIPKQVELRLQQSEILNLYDCAKELKKGKPIQYLLGEAWFMDLKLKINSNVLIPRPETEELCDLIIRENKGVKSILDIGTGSGCIPLALKKHLPEAQIQACDISRDALMLAMKNAELNGINVTFFEADILNEAQFCSERSSSFALIVSNPPYILEVEKPQIDKPVIEHEPHLTLFVEGPDPVLFYRKIISVCRNLLNAGGKLYFELNPLTAQNVLSIAERSGLFSELKLIRDMSGKVRFLRGVRNIS